MAEYRMVLLHRAGAAWGSRSSVSARGDTLAEALTTAVRTAEQSMRISARAAGRADDRSGAQVIWVDIEGTREERTEPVLRAANLILRLRQVAEQLPEEDLVELLDLLPV